MIRFVTINFNKSKLTHALVEQVASFRIPSAITVYDNSGEYVPVGIESVIRNSENMGIGPIWHKEITSCSDQDVLILANNDIVLDDHFFETLTVLDISNAVCAPVIFDVQGKIWSAGGNFHFFPIWRVTHHEQPINVVSRSSHLSGCVLVIVKIPHDARRALAENLERYCFRGEEWQLARNASNSAIDLLLIPELKVTHFENGSHDRFSPEHIYFAFRAKIQFIKINSSALLYVLNLLSYICYIYLAGAFFYQRNSKLPFLKVIQLFNAAQRHSSYPTIKFSDYID